MCPLTSIAADACVVIISSPHNSTTRSRLDAKRGFKNKARLWLVLTRKQIYCPSDTFSVAIIGSDTPAIPFSAYSLVTLFPIRTKRMLVFFAGAEMSFQVNAPCVSNAPLARAPGDLILGSTIRMCPHNTLPHLPEPHFWWPRRPEGPPDSNLKIICVYSCSED